MRKLVTHLPDLSRIEGISIRLSQSRGTRFIKDPKVESLCPRDLNSGWSNDFHERLYLVDFERRNVQLHSFSSGLMLRLDHFLFSDRRSFTGYSSWGITVTYEFSLQKKKSSWEMTQGHLEGLVTFLNHYTERLILQWAGEDITKEACYQLEINNSDVEGLDGCFYQNTPWGSFLKELKSKIFFSGVRRVRYQDRAWFITIQE